MSRIKRGLILLIIIQLLVGGLAHAGPAGGGGHPAAAAHADTGPQAGGHRHHSDQHRADQHHRDQLAGDCDYCAHCISGTPPSSAVSCAPISTPVLPSMEADSLTDRPERLLRPPRTVA